MAAQDLAALLRSLDLTREDETPERAPLAATWEDPAAFRRALVTFAEQRTGPLRSNAGTASDVYADAVLRHASSDRVAFVEIAPRADPARLLSTAMEAADWDGFAKRRRESKKNDRLRGIGLALFLEPLVR